MVRGSSATLSFGGDPAIQRDYQAALGEFLVKFNRRENGGVLERSLKKLGRGDLYRPEAQLSAKLHCLDIVDLAIPALHNLEMFTARQSQRWPTGMINARAGRSIGTISRSTSVTSFGRHF